MTRKEINNIIKSKLGSSFWYHGTSLENASIILKEKKLETKYFEESGIFLAKNITHARLFGTQIFVIARKYISNKKISTDETNDGFFHCGGVELSIIPFAIISETSDLLGYEMAKTINPKITKTQYLSDDNFQIFKPKSDTISVFNY